MSRFKTYDELSESEEFEKRLHDFMTSKPEHRFLEGAPVWLSMMSDSDIAYIIMYMYTRTRNSLLVFTSDTDGFQNIEYGTILDVPQTPAYRDALDIKPTNETTPVFLTLTVMHPLGKWETQKKSYWLNPTEQCSCAINGKITWSFDLNSLKLKIENVVIDSLEILRPGETNFAKILSIDTGYTQENLDTLAKIVLINNIQYRRYDIQKIPEELLSRIKKIVSNPETKQKIVKLSKSVHARSTSRSFGV